MGMELRHLRYFVAVAEDLHFSRAAERLGIAPPTLTTQIQALESELGARLFVRTKRSVELTEAGYRFLDEARATLMHAERAQLVARSAARGEVGQIEVGYISSAACSGTLTRSVSTYRHKHPRVAIHFHKQETGRQLEGIAQRRLDVGFVRATDVYPEGVTGITLRMDPVVLALPNSHRLTRHTEVPSQSLANENFIVAIAEMEGQVFSHTESVGRVGNFTPQIVEVTPDMFTVVTLVASGFGVAVLPASICCISLPGVVYRPLADDLQHAELAFAFRKNDSAPAVRALIGEVRSLWRSSDLTPGPLAISRRNAR